MNYGNGSWNGIVDDKVFLVPILLSSLFCALVKILLSSLFCALEVSGKNENILMSLPKQESKIPQYLKYGDLRSFS